MANEGNIHLAYKIEEKNKNLLKMSKRQKLFRIAKENNIGVVLKDDGQHFYYLIDVANVFNILFSQW